MSQPQRKPMSLLGNRVAEPAPAEAPSPVPTQATRQANREGKRAITVYVSQPVWEELRVLSARSSKPGARITSQELMEEAIALLFQSRGVPDPRK
jgi:hypothetical protein